MSSAAADAIEDAANRTANARGAAAQSSVLVAVRAAVKPVIKLWQHAGNGIHAKADPRYPYILTTYRLTELHCIGISTHVMPYTAEVGIRNLDWGVISTARGQIANVLLGIYGDPNTSIHTTKALTCSVRKGRL
jgi:formate dehydrogenase major subunit